MKALIIDSNNKKVELQNSKIVTDNHSLPISLIDMLVINENSQIDVKTIIKITHQNIPLLLLSKDSKKMALTLPAVAKNAELKADQYRALANREEIARYLISKKLETHKSSVERFEIFLETKEQLGKLKTSSISEMLGIEGSFARDYFSHYFALFEKGLARGSRTKNPPLDPVNAMLSYIYTLAYHAITAKLYMRGFDPSISYLHTPFRSHFALSSDLLETIRADINIFVADLFLSKTLTADDFTNKSGIYLRYESRRKLWGKISIFLDEQNSSINKEIAVLKNLITKTISSATT